ncbi:MAG: hypothetical protein ACOC1K_04340, partial [Nanoarchaeota archaeon]
CSGFLYKEYFYTYEKAQKYINEDTIFIINPSQEDIHYRQYFDSIMSDKPEKLIFEKPDSIEIELSDNFVNKIAIRNVEDFLDNYFDQYQKKLHYIMEVD